MSLEADWVRRARAQLRLAEREQTAAGVVRRGIVVTHGVGSQQRGEQLDTVVEPLVEFLGRALGHENVRLERAIVGDARVADAVIHIGRPGQPAAPLEEWHVREAWWAECFRPSASGTIMTWALRAAIFHFVATAKYAFWKNVEVAWARLRGRAAPPRGAGVWQIPTSRGLYPFLNAFNWLFIMLAYLLVYAVGAVVLLPVMLFLQFPVRWIWPAWAGNAQRALANLITGGIGDQHAMTNRSVAVAAAADTVATALWPFLAPEARRRRSVEYDTVTLVAHSGGCVVSYEALAGDQVRGWAGVQADAKRGGKPCPRVTWVTVGNGLNLGWRMRAPHTDRDKVFWHRPLAGHVNWIDVYARYDPVPQGEAPDDLVRALAGDTLPPYVSVRVANDDWPLTDHGAYWWNFEEVMPRIVHAITDSRLAWQTREQIGQLLDNQDPHDPAAAEASFAKQRTDGTGGAYDKDHMLVPAVKRAVKEQGQARRSKVAITRFVTVLVVLAVAVAFFWGWPFWSNAPIALLGRWLLSQQIQVLAWSLSLAPLLPTQVAGLDVTPLHDWMAGVAGMAVLAFVLSVLWRTGRSFVEWWATARDHHDPLVTGAIQASPPAHSEPAPPPVVPPRGTPPAGRVPTP